MSGPVIIDCRQQSAEWFKLRLGIPTSSRFKDIMTNPRNKKDVLSASARTYMLQLIAEKMTRELTQMSDNADMARGRELEPMARKAYEFRTDNDVVETGIILNHGVGASPDGLVGDNGAIEIKCRRSHHHIDALIKNEMPDEYKAQVQGFMYISEREWVDFVMYHEKLRMFIKRVHRDDVYIKTLAECLSIFQQEMQKCIEKLDEVEF